MLSLMCENSTLEMDTKLHNEECFKHFICRTFHLINMIAGVLSASSSKCATPWLRIQFSEHAFTCWTSCVTGRSLLTGPRIWEMLSASLHLVENCTHFSRRLVRAHLFDWASGSGTDKFDHRLSRLLHAELHWLDVPERVAYKLCIMLHGQAPQYLMDFCHPTSSITSRQQLWSASRRLLVIPRCRLNTTAWWAFSVVGPSVWNSLPD